MPISRPSIKQEYEYGSGLYQYRGMDEDTDSEWRFEKGMVIWVDIKI